ncbi:hypothetical protein G6F37_007687 [Rhizopus arrhizus]|nr:hypothetical protein G6F38_008112 [Rhizopus arrhizus]KAG1156356.1 hypothetical protein G6F37_007687 [Rhizopus arrhizus]
MTSRSESPLQLMSIAKQFPSRIAAATTKKDSRKIAEINFDPLNPAIDHIENDTFRHLPYRALDSTVPLVRIWLSNFPFFEEHILKE